MGNIRNLKEYFRALKAQLVCPKSEQNRFLTKAKQTADDFRQGNLEATEADVIEFLGDPKDLAMTFLETVDPDLLAQYQRKRAWLKLGIAVSAILAICLLSAWCFYLKTYTIIPNITATETLIIYPEVTE